MSKLLLALTLVLSVTLSSDAAACAVDGHCAPGARCVIDPGQLFGVCVGGSKPGNDNDLGPRRTPRLSEGYTKRGVTCSGDHQCGGTLHDPGRCVKSPGQLTGVCDR